MIRLTARAWRAWRRTRDFDDRVAARVHRQPACEGAGFSAEPAPSRATEEIPSSVARVSPAP